MSEWHDNRSLKFRAYFKSKKCMLFPITRQDLDTYGWKSSPDVYQTNLDLPFDFDIYPRLINSEILLYKTLAIDNGANRG